MHSLVIYILSLIYIAFALYSAGHALLNKRDSRSALGWVASCLLIPYVGPFIYLIFGINRTRSFAKIKRPFITDEDELRIDCEHTHVSFKLAVVGKNVTQNEVLPCDEIKILINGNEAYPEMLKAIASASDRVYLSSYIFANDETGKSFIEALQKAKARGVEVKILLDGMGELSSIPRIGNKIEKYGLEYKRFNPIKLFGLPLQINMRNHRKLLVIDGKLAFTGGMNISDNNILDKGKIRKKVQDIHFSLCGPIAIDLESVFLKDWRYSSGEVVHINKEINKPSEQANIWTRLILDGPNENIDKLSNVLIGNFSCANNRLWLMTPYFLPDAEIIGALQAAKLRGIDVKIILPEKNNIRISHWATKHLLWKLLSHGIEVYFQPSPFTHSKLLIIDDQYSLIGSANIDPRSLRLNFELGVEIFSENINKEITNYIDKKLQRSKKITFKELKERGVVEKLRDAIAGLLSPYL